MTVGEGGAAVMAFNLRWLCLVISILAAETATAQESSREAPPQLSEAAAQADAEALADQEQKAIEQAEREIVAEERVGIDAEAETVAKTEEEALEEADEIIPGVPPDAPPVDDAKTSAPWSPPAPDEGVFDWLQTTSGEWLKGDFERLRDRDVDFDSDEFDRQSLDWKDVAYFRFSRPHTFRFEGRRIVSGAAEMRKGVIKVRTSDGVREFPRNEIVSITQGAQDAEFGHWSALIAIGTGLRRGNTKQADFSGRGNIMRETALTRWSIEYDGAFSRVDGNTATNTHRAWTGLDFFVTRRFYVTIPFVQFFKDQNQRIDQQYTPGIGIGYELLRNDWIETDTTLGGGVQHTRFDTGNTDLDAAFIFSIETELDLPRDVEWDSSYSLQLVPTDFGKTNHHVKSVLSFEIWDPLDLDFVFNWDRVESPESQSGQSKPKSDDYRLSIEIAIDW